MCQSFRPCRGSLSSPSEGNMWNNISNPVFATPARKCESFFLSDTPEHKSSPISLVNTRRLIRERCTTLWIWQSDQISFVMSFFVSSSISKIKSLELPFCDLLWPFFDILSGLVIYRVYLKKFFCRLFFDSIFGSRRMFCLNEFKKKCCFMPSVRRKNKETHERVI